MAKVESNKIRVVIGKVGLDGHNKGMFVVAKILADAGFEVIMAGIRLSPEEFVETAIQEDADVIGLSSLSGSHLALFSRVAEILRQKNAGDKLFIAGGVIPEEDIPALKKAGITRVFLPETPADEIVKFIRENVKKTVRPTFRYRPF